MTDQSIYLVRHGETAFNADGRLRGLADPDLHAAGLGQAKSLASALASAGTSIIVSSPLLRVVHTAAIIAQSCQTEHKVDVRFNDRDYGRWTGQPKTDVIAQWGTVDAAPGVEPTSSILSRARPALDAWAEQAQACDHTLIVVTHDAVIRPLLINIAPALPLPNVPTGSYQLLRRHQTTWRIERTDQLP